jgi:hypothetical protein
MATFVQGGRRWNSLASSAVFLIGQHAAAAEPHNGHQLSASTTSLVSGTCQHHANHRDLLARFTKPSNFAKLKFPSKISSGSPPNSDSHFHSSPALRPRASVGPRLCAQYILNTDWSQVTCYVSAMYILKASIQGALPFSDVYLCGGGCPSLTLA